ncbi:MAG: PIG-L deacetylase family protein, partial [Acidimicrobiales bacterium]
MSGSALVFAHAHPDDESVLTGATLAKANALGFRTVVVYGTRGDAGETGQDLQGESLGDRRVREAEAACTELGVDRIEWLPYDDSGMAGTDTTTNPRAFCNANIAEAAALTADRLSDETVGAVVGYDSNGTYSQQTAPPISPIWNDCSRQSPPGAAPTIVGRDGWA